MKSQNDDGDLTVEEAASRLFGVKITSDEVIGETLQRVTDGAPNLSALAGDIKAGSRRWREPGYDYEKFKEDPIAVWVELTLGIDISKTPPERARPLTITKTPVSA